MTDPRGQDEDNPDDHPDTELSPQDSPHGPTIADPYGNTTGQTLDVHFRTDRLPPYVQLITSNFVATYNAQSPARVGLSSVNTSSASLSLYRLAADDPRLTEAARVTGTGTIIK